MTTNAGNPAGAQFPPMALANLVLFDGDDIIQQSLPMDPDLIPVSISIPTLPQWALLILAMLVAMTGGAAICGRRGLA